MSRSATSSSSSLLVFALVAPLGLAGCSADPAPSDPRLRAFLDEPHSIPAGVPYAVASAAGESSQSVDEPDACGRGRGIDGDGRCVPMATRDLDSGGMVQIPAGRFVRGEVPRRFGSKRDLGRPYVQNPGHPMWTDELPAFWIDGFEVPRSAYARCVAAGACTPASCLDGSDGRPKREVGARELDAIPQTCVTHGQAAAYCAWRGARLPTEGEWEYAARGPVGWTFPWGHELRDELGVALGPVGFDAIDISYFGLKGFGGNASEWTADRFEVDANLSRYAEGFRRPDGPLARARSEWNRSLCGRDSCGERYVVKGGRCGARMGAWEFAEDVTLGELPARNVDNQFAVAQHPSVGFRCAQDLGPDETGLTVPEALTPPTLSKREGGVELFFAVAEAVDRREAERFCQLLRAPGDPEAGGGWRLPTLAEIRAAARWFGGPGPFWTAEGAAEQTYVDSEQADWDAREVADDEALMARCVRS